MPEIFEILSAWLGEDGTVALLPIPLVAIGIAGLTAFSRVPKGLRAALAVIALLAPMCAPLLLSRSRSFATFDWVVVSAMYVVVAAMLARFHIRQVRSDVKSFFKKFNSDEPKEDWLVAEGSSSFNLLIFGIYGLAALLGSIVCYLYIGVTRTPEGFIFQNNEGFLAAIGLLIIVLAGVAVPIYTDLAKKVRAEIDLYESQVSSLQQASTNAGHHADFLWTHFERVARLAIREWSRTTSPLDMAEASHLMLFMPFLAIGEMRAAGRRDATLENSGDEVFKQFLNMNLKQFPYAKPPEKLMAGASEHYFTPADASSSLKRAVLFLQSSTEILDPSTRRNITEGQGGSQRHRSRRLTYLGWSLQGELARAKARYGDRAILAPSAERDMSLGVVPDLAGNGEPSWEFENSTQFLLPATEEFFVALLQQKYEAVYSRALTDSPDDITPVHEFQNQFRKRAERHIRRWSEPNNNLAPGSLSQILVGQGDCLDFDVSSLSDDLSLFYHLFVATRDGMNQGADARFLYYAFWLIALTTSGTQVSQVLNRFGNAGDDRDDDDRDDDDRDDDDRDDDVRRQLTASFDRLQKHFTVERLTKAMTSRMFTPDGVEEEFLLLSLADHKSALYNWLRAARSTTTREMLSSYESKLDHLNFRTQLGIEILPRRANRIEHLRKFLDVGEAQKPLAVRSIFDLLPVESATTLQALQTRRFSSDSYLDYRRVVDDLSISNNFSTDVSISRANVRKVAEMVTMRENFEVRADTLTPRKIEFLKWICDCLSDGHDLAPLAKLLQLIADENCRLIAKALWLVSPVFRNEINQYETPAADRTPLTDVDRDEQFRAILANVRAYCRNRENAQNIQNTLFGGHNHATAVSASERYATWYEGLGQRWGENNVG